MGTNPAETAVRRPRLTLASLAKMREPFACLTCYDATTAKWLTRAGVHVLLVGDTAAEMVLGYSRTIDMPLDVLLALTAGVKRGAMMSSAEIDRPTPLVMGDMPFMSYQASADDAMKNAGRFLVEGLADVVKIEADETLAPLVDRLVRAGVPVCAHVGSKPQRLMVTGGYAAAGRTTADAERVRRDARALQDAGASLVLIEAVPEATARTVVEESTVPVIGIGAGASCHGQVLVLQDVMGMTAKPPAFVEAMTNLGEQMQAAAERWVKVVAARGVGESPYSMR